MPGIAGIICRSATGHEGQQLQTMLSCMMHEPYYTCATYQQDALGVYAGLVAIEGDYSSRIAMTNDARDKVMLFSGEIFNEAGEARQPIQLYEELGEDFLAALNGWFSGLVVDIPAQRVILFNDRYASHKRLYFRETPDAYYFASEAKALLSIFPECRAFDLEALGEYFVCDCALENKTLFRGIALMPGGSAWTFTRGELHKRAYFDPAEWENQTSLEQDAFDDAFVALFKQVVSRYTGGVQPVGMSLTGGLDTRMIMAAAQPSPGALPCYTFGGMYRDSFDVLLAREVAGLYGQPLHVIRVGHAFLDDFATHAARSVFVTDGLAPVNISDEVTINRAAREIAPVRLTGKFGSQVMRGASLLAACPPPERLFDAAFLPCVVQARHTLDSIRQQVAHRLSFVLFRELPWYWAGSSVAESSQLTVRSPFLDNDLVRLLYRAPVRDFAGHGFQVGAIQAYDPRAMRVRTDQGLGGTAPPGLRDLTRLGYRFLSVGDRLYNWEKMPDWVAQADARLAWTGLYRVFLGRQRFRHYRKWFRDELNAYVQQVLLDGTTLQRPYWHGATLRRMVVDHTTGRANHSHHDPQGARGGACPADVVRLRVMGTTR